MGGPNLEIFKFSLYLFIPIAALVHFGDPEWYRKHVVPYREKLFPPEERTNKTIPKHHAALREEIEKLKAERRAKLQAKREPDPEPPIKRI